MGERKGETPVDHTIMEQCVVGTNFSQKRKPSAESDLLQGEKLHNCEKVQYPHRDRRLRFLDFNTRNYYQSTSSFRSCCSPNIGTTGSHLIQDKLVAFSMPFTQQKPTLPVSPPLFSGQELQAKDRNLTNDHVAFYGKKIFLPSNSTNIHRNTSLMYDQNVVREDVKAQMPAATQNPLEFAENPSTC